jgi:predicted N-acetyltransferase YhbS
MLIRKCGTSELASVIGHLDQEFVFGKHRRLSLARRFPNTLSADNLGHINVAVADGTICGTIATRLFTWTDGQSQWQGGMIGMVWVNPVFRERGIGQRLLTAAGDALKSDGIDFGVLWTGIPAYYARKGWYSSDRGLFGEKRSAPPGQHGAEVTCHPLAAEDVPALEAIGYRHFPDRVTRGTVDYQTIPIPAIVVHCFLIRKGEENGYALVGEEDGTGYLYEAAAESTLWEALWSAIAERFDRLYVNGRLGDGFSSWLAENKYVDFQPQNKTMWLRVSDRSANARLDTWHIPFFDRM